MYVHNQEMYLNGLQAMSTDSLKFSDSMGAEVIRPELIKTSSPASISPMVPSPITAPVHFLSLPLTKEPTDLHIDDFVLPLPAGQPSVAIEAHFPFTVKYGPISRVFVADGNPNIPHNINIIS